MGNKTSEQIGAETVRAIRFSTGILAVVLFVVLAVLARDNDLLSKKLDKLLTQQCPAQEVAPLPTCVGVSEVQLRCGEVTHRLSVEVRP